MSASTEPAVRAVGLAKVNRSANADLVVFSGLNLEVAPGEKLAQGNPSSHAKSYRCSPLVPIEEMVVSEHLSKTLPPLTSEILAPDTPSEAISAWRSTLIIVVLGMGGMVAMFALLAKLSITSTIAEATIGILFMMALMIPIIYVNLVKPIRREFHTRAEITRVLQESKNTLEVRVTERTVQLEEALAKLEQTHRDTLLIAEMVELLQACVNASESKLMMARFGAKLFPEGSGGVFLYRPSRNLLELAANWGDYGKQVKTFSPDDCWALRRGRDHLIEGGRQDVYCRHSLAEGPNPGSTLCIPMMAQGEATGLLVLQGKETGIPKATRTLALLATEQIALAVANLQLREKLRDQAIRDPLTAMFNRRYFEETAARELLRAGENGTTVGMIMIDVDHFKRFNDSHGHDAGDAVLQRVGLTLQAHTRVEDVVCRYGGEEFLMLLPDLPDDATVKRADELREVVRELNVRFHGETLAKITISCGVAVFPSHGGTCGELIDAADHALYRAKEGGRNRVEVAA